MCYSAQSKPPWTHSKTNPTIRINRKIIEIKEEVKGFARVLKYGKGNRRATSRSNRRNKIATRKKRNEKGIRADFNGSNPHS